MFEWLTGPISDFWNGFIEWFWNTVIAPIWRWLKGWFSAAVTVVVAVVGFAIALCQLVVDLVQQLITAITQLMGINAVAINFGSSTSLLGKINYFVPLQEFFSLLAVTLLIWAVALTIRFVKWIREIFLP